MGKRWMPVAAAALTILIQTVVGAATPAQATVIISEPDRIIEVTIAKSARDEYLQEIKDLSEAFSFYSSFSPSDSIPGEPFPLLWRDDIIIYVQPMTSDDTSRLAYLISIYSRDFEPISPTDLDDLTKGLGSAAAKFDDATFTITK